MSVHLLVRSASLINYANVARDVGLDPEAMLEEVGLPVQALHDVELWIPSLKVRALLDRSSLRSGREDFGLRLAETRHPWTLGALALAIREQPTLRPALQVLSHHIRLHNGSLHFWLEEDPRSVTLRLELTGGGQLRQSTELSLGIIFRLLRAALPDTWQPMAVCMRHSRSRDTSTARRVFGVHPVYDSEMNGIVFRPADMDLPMATFLRLDELTRKYVHWLKERSGSSTTAQVRQLVFALIGSGHCSLSLIAGHLDLQERTLHRRLSDEDTTYLALLNQTRRELVESYLGSGARSQAELSELLGFSGTTVFCRWFRSQYGMTTRTWRARRQAPTQRRRYDRISSVPTATEITPT